MCVETAKSECKQEQAACVTQRLRNVGSETVARRHEIICEKTVKRQRLLQETLCKETAKSGEHNCIGAGQIGYGLRSRPGFSILPMGLAASKPTTAREIADAVKLHHHVAITYGAAAKNS